MSSTYEVAVLYHPDFEVDLTKAEEKTRRILADAGAKIVKTDNWGKRKLAYPIAKQDYAIYVFHTVDMPGANVRKIESALNISNEVIRYLITRLDLKAIAKAEAAKAEKAKRAMSAQADAPETENSTTKSETKAVTTKARGVGQT